MDVNKVVYGDETLIDLSGDSVTPETLLQGATAHNAAGAAIEGVVDLSTKQDKITASGILKGNGSGGVSAAVAGNDYIVMSHLTTWLNRTTAVHTADTNYTTYMARGIALASEETTPTVNGTIVFVYG